MFCGKTICTALSFAIAVMLCVGCKSSQPITTPTPQKTAEPLPATVAKSTPTPSPQLKVSSITEPRSKFDLATALTGLYSELQQTGVKSPTLFVVAYGAESYNVIDAAKNLKKTAEGRRVLSKTCVFMIGPDKFISNRLGYAGVINGKFMDDSIPLDHTDSGDKFNAFFKVDEDKYSLWGFGISLGANPHAWYENYETIFGHVNLSKMNKRFAGMTPGNTIFRVPTKK